MFLPSDSLAGTALVKAFLPWQLFAPSLGEGIFSSHQHNPAVRMRSSKPTAQLKLQELRLVPGKMLQKRIYIYIYVYAQNFRVRSSIPKIYTIVV